MNSILKKLFSTLWGYLLPKVWDLIQQYLKKRKIDREVDEETDRVEEIRAEVSNFFKENPNATEVPKELEDRLRAALRERASFMRK